MSFHVPEDDDEVNSMSLGIQFCDTTKRPSVAKMKFGGLIWYSDLVAPAAAGALSRRENGVRKEVKIV